MKRSTSRLLPEDVVTVDPFAGHAVGDDLLGERLEGRLTVDRHGGGPLVSFADGHQRSIDLPVVLSTVLVDIPIRPL